MAFDPLNDAEISAGEPNKQELWQKLKLNQADLDDRVTAVEGAGFIPIHFQLSGPVSVYDPETKVDPQRVTFKIKLLAGRVMTQIAGTSGNCEIDILYKRGAGAWTSIFSSRPSSAFGDGDWDIATGILTVTELEPGDLVAMDVIGAQDGQKGLTGILEFEEA